MPRSAAKNHRDERKYHPYNLADKCNAEQQPEMQELTDILLKISIQAPHSETRISETLVKHSSIYESVEKPQPTLSLKLPTTQDSQGYYACN